MKKRKETPKTIWLAGGGTGGHISPAISIYENLSQRDHKPVLITLERNKDYPSIKNLDKKNKKVIFCKASPIPKSIKLLVLFIRDIQFSFQLFNEESRKTHPDAVLAFGGYPVFGVLLWALFNKVPFYLHEQNERHGMITRLFSLRAKKVFLSFPQKQYGRNEVLTGNPLRKIFLEFKGKKPTIPVKKQSEKNKNIKSKRRILLLGGSQGASDINNLYLEMCKSDIFKNDVITISTGKIDFERIKKQTKNLNRKNDQIFSFIEDVPGTMMANDFIISRSGSGMIFEILWSKKPACFIPYPHAASDHQKYNSLAISDFGQYETIDIRPFDAVAALDSLIWFFSTHAQKGLVSVHKSNKIPLNAHQIITDYLVRNT
jgi:UDP-N-acetylglucosamine--N-acetylmuramyl-(pentapeptide) pyrophosphoryl-undecaprenol N-acetylglucosamine transferase